MLAKAAGKKTSLKAALLDQRVVAGLGNIYVCEALYRARLSPKRQASTIADRNGGPNARADGAGRGHPGGLQDAIAAGGSSLRDHRRTDGELGYFQHSFRVYDREGERNAGPLAAAASSSASPRTGGRPSRIFRMPEVRFPSPSCAILLAAIRYKPLQETSGTASAEVSKNMEGAMWGDAGSR